MCHLDTTGVAVGRWPKAKGNDFILVCAAAVSCIIIVSQNWNRGTAQVRLGWAHKTKKG
jgi:hypothetical protein